MIILSHPTGNPPVRNALQALLEAEMLSCFCTSFALPQNSRLLKYAIPSSIKRELLRRTYDLPRKLIQSKPTLELFRLAGQRVIGSHFGSGPINRVYESVDKLAVKIAKNKHPQGIYAYEDGALNSFRYAEKNGIHRFYELPIVYWKVLHKILKEQIAHYPEWEKTMEFSQDSEKKCQKKDHELELANSIICPSPFVLESVPEKYRSRCKILPYGAPAPQRNSTKHDSHHPLRILFAGSMTQRKGLADLFSAVKSLKTHQCELIVMGKLRAPLEFYKKQFPNFTYEPPRNHAQVLELMRSCDIFCLPSIIEGRALVQLEALSCGLPLIITPNTGGSDLIKEKKTGFLIPPNTPTAIAEKIDWFLSNRSSIQEMKHASWDMAEHASWAHYRCQLVSFLTERLKHR